MNPRSSSMRRVTLRTEGSSSTSNTTAADRCAAEAPELAETGGLGERAMQGARSVSCVPLYPMIDQNTKAKKGVGSSRSSTALFRNRRQNGDPAQKSPRRPPQTSDRAPATD